MTGQSGADPGAAPRSDEKADASVLQPQQNNISGATPAIAAAAQPATAPDQPQETQLWWYAVKGVSYGPASEEQLKTLAQAGYFSKHDFVYAGYIGNWVRADSVHGLFDGVGVTGAPPSPAGQVCVPAASAPPPSTFAAKEYAGFWVRLLALVIDTIVLQGGMCATWMFAASSGALSGYLSFLLGPAGLGFDLSDATSLASSTAAYSLFWLAVYWLYFACLESSPWQATLGKRAVGIMVTDLRGARISFYRATGRCFASLLSYATFYVGFILGAFTLKKQTLHDLIADTTVIYGKA